jgi:hypothetical protein
MSERRHLLTPSFNRSVQVEGRDERLGTAGGAVLLREIMQLSGLRRFLANRLQDPRRQAAIWYPIEELVCAYLLLIAQGWRHGQDADRLRHAPALCISATQTRGPAAVDQPLPSQPTLSRTLDILARGDNRAILAEALAALAGTGLKARRRGHRKRAITVDIDGLAFPVEGHQPGSAWNGHHGCRCYDPLIASSAELGDMLGAALRPGNAGSAAGAKPFILDVVERAERHLCQVALIRLDAGFPSEDLLAALEANGTPYIARLKANPALDRLSAPYRKRPRGRPPHEPRLWCLDLSYQAGPWSTPRRVVLVLKERAEDRELDRFYLVTSIAPERMTAEEILARYRQRGTAESHMGELKEVCHPALSATDRPKACYANRPIVSAGQLPSRAFARNEALLLLNQLAYQIMHIARRALETARGEGVSLHWLRRTMLVIGTRVVTGGRQLKVIIENRFVDLWSAVIHRLYRWQWTPP